MKIKRGSNSRSWVVPLVQKCRLVVKQRAGLPVQLPTTVAVAELPSAAILESSKQAVV